MVPLAQAGGSAWKQEVSLSFRIAGALFLLFATGINQELQRQENLKQLLVYCLI